MCYLISFVGRYVVFIIFIVKVVYLEIVRFVVMIFRKEC